MVGRISEGDKEKVREANPIDQVVREYVALRNAGGGNMKGLCPFHDEKTPSFQVSPTRLGGRYHCFGCGEGGDVFDFIAAVEHLSFMEAVERLAERGNVILTLVEGGTAPRIDRGSRSRLTAANKAAAVFYAEQLRVDGPEPARARDFLAERGFDLSAAEHFGCGFAPSGWDSLVKALTKQGFTLEELMKAGLAKQGQRGPIDAFHRRLLWPIRDGAGDVVGFGARRLFDDDRLEAKYINTAETVLYRKSQVLFGLDLAKKDIAKERTAVVVEGYTDVMAMHLAGVTTAVASCGTAFGDEHITVLRRYLLDSDFVPGQVIYTFDGDSAGQKAALKAFESDQKFTANTSVAIAPDGLDPCELRQQKGDQAVRDLVAGRQPLYAFAIKQSLERFDLRSAEGRVAAAAATIPLVARIKQPLLRDQYTRELAGWVGVDSDSLTRQVRRQVAADGAGERRPAQRPEPDRRGQDQPPASGPSGPPRPDPADPRLFAEREVMKLTLQQPVMLGGGYQHLGESSFQSPAYARLHLAIMAAGGPWSVDASPGSVTDWPQRVNEQLPEGILRSLVTELAVEPIRVAGEVDPSYAGAILASLAVREALQRDRELRSELQRAESGGDHARVAELNEELMANSAYLRALRERANGASTS